MRGSWGWAWWCVTDVQRLSLKAKRQRKATAERMRAKAAAYEEYGDTVMAQQVLQCLPKLAAEVAKPLKKTHEVVILGDSDRASQDITRLAANLQPAVHALTGIDLSKALAKAIN